MAAKRKKERSYNGIPLFRISSMKQLPTAPDEQGWRMFSYQDVADVVEAHVYQYEIKPPYLYEFVSKETKRKAFFAPLHGTQR